MSDDSVSTTGLSKGRFHPLAKLILLVCYCVLVLVLANFVFSIVLLLLILVVLRAAGIPFELFVRKTRFILVFSLALFLLQVLFTHSGRTLFTLVPSFVPVIGGALPVTSIGVENGIVMACRFLCIITSSFVFISATHPNDFAHALMQVGLPYRYGFTLITTLRFMPVFGKEYNVVRRAQLARGMEVSVRPKRLMRTIRLTFLPLLVSGLTKVDSLAISMEGRGFGMHKKRTFVRKLRFTGMDAAVSGAALVVTVVVSILVVWQSLPLEYHI